jgi:uncharacterized ion transporter superfamily protein YfcC
MSLPSADEARSRFPHPLALLVGGVLLAAALSYVLPAGKYDRREDPATGRSVVVAGTYHSVPPHHVGPFAALVAIPEGMADAAAVVFFVFLVGGAFTIVDRTGALRHGVDGLVQRLERREAWVIPIASVAFATAGALENMQEEIIALIPVLLLLTRRAGFDALTAVAMSAGAAAVGAAFSPINPFQVGIAQKLASLPLLSGWAFRLPVLVVAVALWIWGTLRHAARTRRPPEMVEDPAHSVTGARQGVVLALVLVAFAVFVYGVMRLGWDFNQMSAVFFLMGIAAGLVGGLRISGTVEAFVEGLRDMTLAALLIGFARAIYVVLDRGQIIDTIVHGMFGPLAQLPLAASAIGMMVVHTAIHVPVPSVSGQAVLTMPLLVPLSDLLGLSRQVTILAYQYGAGLCDLLTPTNGGLMAVLAAARVPYERWLRFLMPVYLGLVLLGMIAIGVALATRLV